MKVGINDFARKHLDSEFPGTILMEKELERARELAEEKFDESKEGYAPFCREVILRADEMPGVVVPYAKITPDNEHKLYSAYEEREEGELPFLNRWFYAGEVEQDLIKPAMIKLILYSRTQLLEEKAASTEAPWELVTVLAMGEPESPMSPQTMIRNHFGPQTGGSGAKFDPMAYRASCKFWNEHAMVRGG